MMEEIMTGFCNCDAKKSESGDHRHGCDCDIICAQARVCKCESDLFCAITTRLSCEIKYARNLRELACLIELANGFMLASAQKENALGNVLCCLGCSK